MSRFFFALAVFFGMGSVCAQEQITAGCLVGIVKSTGDDGSMIVEWTNAGCKDEALSEYTAAAVADVTSTALALGFGRDALYEANPMGLGGGLVLKVAGYVALKHTEPSPERTRWASRASAVQWGLAVNNVCLFSGAAMPFCQAIGVIAGALILNKSEQAQPVMEFLGN